MAIDWNDVVPEHVALRQRAWERRRLIWRGRNVANLSYVKLGKMFGMSNTNAWRLCLQWELHTGRRRSPVEIYLAESVVDTEEIAGYLRELA